MSRRPELVGTVAVVVGDCDISGAELGLHASAAPAGLVVGGLQSGPLARSLETRRGWNAESGYDGGDGWIGLVRCECRSKRLVRCAETPSIGACETVASTKDAEPVPQQPEPTSSPQVLVIEEPSQPVADYGTSASEGAWVSGPEESLGYRYRQGLQPLKAKLVGKTSGRMI